MSMATNAEAVRARPMTREEKRVIMASSAGTIFEWYDFYLYGSLAAIIGAQFFSSFPEATRNVFALLAFAAGFLVRPFGALFFGRLGDLVGRKYTFLMTILIMGASMVVPGLVTSAVDIFVKDLGIVLQAGTTMKAALPIAAAAHQMFLATSGQGKGTLDDSQVIAAYRKVSGK